MRNHWLDQAKKQLQAEATEPSDIPFDRLRAEGVINDRGEVSGQVYRWNADLAITEVKRTTDGRQIEVFRCLKPAFGLPGGTTIDIARDSMVSYLKSGKKVVTATRDDRLGIWKPGCDIRLTADGFVQCDAAGESKVDNVGSLPELRQSTSRL